MQSLVTLTTTIITELWQSVFYEVVKGNHNLMNLFLGHSEIIIRIIKIISLCIYFFMAR